MNQKYPPSPSADRAGSVWVRFVGMFGGDAVRRRYGDTAPVEWVAMLARLTDYELERGMRRLVYSGRGHVPSLPEFVKLCRTIGQADDISEGPQAPQLPAPDNDHFDVWGIAANRHLLAYVLERTPRRTRRYAPDWTSRGGTVHPGPETIERTAILVKWKNEWADRMRAIADDHGVDAADQRDIWANCMTLAENEIDALARQQAA